MVREWAVPRAGGHMVRWDCGDGRQQFGVDAWIASADDWGATRLAAATKLSAALQDAALSGDDLKPLPVMQNI